MGEVALFLVCPQCRGRRPVRFTTDGRGRVVEVEESCACQRRVAAIAGSADAAYEERKRVARRTGACMDCAEPVAGKKGHSTRCAVCRQRVDVRRRQQLHALNNPLYETRRQRDLERNRRPERAGRKRQLALAQYYASHPNRPNPTCGTCLGPVRDWCGVGAATAVLPDSRVPPPLRDRHRLQAQAPPGRRGPRSLYATAHA